MSHSSYCLEFNLVFPCPMFSLRPWVARAIKIQPVRAQESLPRPGTKPGRMENVKKNLGGERIGITFHFRPLIPEARPLLNPIPRKPIGFL